MRRPRYREADGAPGTKYTSTTQNGQTIKYTCNGKTGDWDHVTGPPIQPQGPRAPMAGGGVYAR